jgi:hypothetical protein
MSKSRRAIPDAALAEMREQVELARLGVGEARVRAGSGCCCEARSQLGHDELYPLGGERAVGVDALGQRPDVQQRVAVEAEGAAPRQVRVDEAQRAAEGGLRA